MRESVVPKSQILTLRDVVAKINGSGDLHAVLEHLVSAACRDTSWALGSIMGIDAAHGLAHVIVRHDPTLIERPLPDKWELATSPSLIAVQRNEPIYIEDARESHEFPGYRKEAFERDYRSVLVLPMSCKDGEGRPMVLSVIARTITALTDEDFAFLSSIIQLGAIAVEREHRLLEQKRSAGRLERALKAHTSLLERVLSDESFSSLSAMVGTILPNPILVMDFTANQVFAGRSPNQVAYDDRSWQHAASTILARSLMKSVREEIGRGSSNDARLFVEDAGRSLRLAARIEPLVVDTQPAGALVIFQTPNEFSELDLLLLDSVKFALSVQMMRSLIRFRSETRTQTELFMEIMEARWHDAGDVSRRAQRLGLNFVSSQQLVVIEFPRTANALESLAADIVQSVSRMMQQASVQASLIAIEGGIVCLVPADKARLHEKLGKVLPRVAEELSCYFDEQPIIVASGRCEGLADYPAEWERCRRMIGIARSFGLSGAIDSRDFGPLPMLIAASETGEVRSFVLQSVGVIADHDKENGTPYLQTLSTYLHENCRSQACADTMGLHVTTLRYRLARIRELFDVDVETPEKRFAIELAIRLHEVIGSQARPTR